MGNKARRMIKIKSVNWCQQMAQHVKGPCHKLNKLSLIPGTLMVEENFHDLSSNFHIYTFTTYKHKTNSFKDPMNDIKSN